MTYIQLLLLLPLLHAIVIFIDFTQSPSSKNIKQNETQVFNFIFIISINIYIYMLIIININVYIILFGHIFRGKLCPTLKSFILFIFPNYIYLFIFYLYFHFNLIICNQLFTFKDLYLKICINLHSRICVCNLINLSWIKWI